MRMTRREPIYLCLLLLLLSAGAHPVAADTIAIAVRERSDAEEAPLLAELVEQSAMDRLFLSGHIVFDLEINPDDEVFSFHAIDQAQVGGARTVLVIELELDLESGDLQMPGRIIVEYLDAETEERLGAATIDARTIPRHNELPPTLLAERLGDKAAEMALTTLGGESAW